MPLDDTPTLPEPPPELKFRTVFISDVHLGSRNCQAEKLLRFLKYVDCERIYLVGDIIDSWALKRHWHWVQAHNDVIQKLLRKARKGTKVVYIPGNHDENFRDIAGQVFGNFQIKKRHMHVTADQKRYLVVHGDEFDGIVLYAKWLAYLGDQAYEWAIFVNRYVNMVRRLFRLRYWSLSAFLKRKVKNAVEFIGNFENALVNEARRNHADGVVCGHIHTPEMRMIDGLHYCNDGDWVESCTALVEHYDGQLEILIWDEVEEALNLNSEVS